MLFSHLYYGIFGAFCSRCGFKTDFRIMAYVAPRSEGDPQAKFSVDPCEFLLFCPKCDVPMIVLDNDITDALCKLNLLGHKTEFSCQGHVARVNGGDALVEYPYVSFKFPSTPEDSDRAITRTVVHKHMKFANRESKYQNIDMTEDGEWIGWTGANDPDAPEVFLSYLTEFTDLLEKIETGRTDLLDLNLVGELEKRRSHCNEN